MKKLYSSILFASLAFATTTFAEPLSATVDAVTDRVTAERREKAAKGAAVKQYEDALAELENMKAHANGDGALREIDDTTRNLPRLKALADIERKAALETEEVSRKVAFCETFCPVLVLDDAEALAWIQHLAKPGDDLEKSNKDLYRKTISTEFEDKLAVAIAKYGCGFTQYVFTYASKKNVEKLQSAIRRRIAKLAPAE